MKRFAVRSSWLLCALGALVVLSACGQTYVDAPAEPSAPTSQAPSVRRSTAPLAVREGASATFTVTAEGTEPMKYQWQRDGVDIAGAVECNFALASVTRADDGGRYSVRISNAAGSVARDVGQLVVVENNAAMFWQ